MSHGNQSYLRFSLEESVWFQKGQEVDDLLSISLDPDITIQESDQYITIKGALELTGEYSREESAIVEEDDYDFFSKSPRSVHIVELREDEGTYAFTHQFPVEVTIPKNRIQNLDEIDVAVETFDYAFPEKSCLRLTADLMIIGLYGEQQHFHDEEEELEEIVEIEIDGIEEIEEIEDDEPTYSDDLEGFAPYARPETEIPEIEIDQAYELYQEERKTEDQIEEVAAFSKPDVPEEIDEVYEPFEVEARKIPLEEEIIEELKSFQSFQDKYPEISLVQDEDIRKENVKEQPNTPVLQAPIEETPINETPIEEAPIEETPINETPIEEAPAPQKDNKGKKVPEIIFTPHQPAAEEPEASLEDNEEVSEHEEESAPSKGKKKKGKKLKNKQSITLSEFFARKDEEELTKLKMCIVQNGDTLDNLSERYEVPISQIQRVNQMELNQDIYEGQVLYIPVPQSQR